MSPNAFECVQNDIDKQPHHKTAETEADDGGDFERALTLTGYGAFHYKIVAISALCLITNGIQNNLAPYVFPQAQCDLHLTATQLSFINVAFLVGGISSAFLWGLVADMFGRRTVLAHTLLANACFTFASAFVRNFHALFVCRYCNGFLIGAAGSITFNYIAEFHSTARRKQSVLYAGCFFTTALILLPLISYVIIPLGAIPLGGDVTLASWRLFLIVCAIPELVAGILLCFLPESPSFLAEHNATAAIVVLQRMFAENNKLDGDLYPVKQLRCGGGGVDGEAPVVCVGRFKRMIAEMFVEIKKMFLKPLWWITLIVCGVMFCNMFGYFGLGLWLPELFMRFELYAQLHPNETVTLRALAGFEATAGVNSTCLVEFNSQLFTNTFIVGCASIIGNALSGYAAGKTPLRVVPMVTMLLGAIAATLIYHMTRAWQHLLAACIFQAVMTIGNVALGGVVVELYPTAIAGMALCLTIFTGRVSGMISNIVFGLYMSERCEVPLFLVAAFLYVGAALCLLIPNQRDTQKKYCHTPPQKLSIAVISSD